MKKEVSKGKLAQKTVTPKKKTLPLKKSKHSEKTQKQTAQTKVLPKKKTEKSIINKTAKKSVKKSVVKIEKKTAGTKTTIIKNNIPSSIVKPIAIKQTENKKTHAVLQKAPEKFKIIPKIKSGVKSVPAQTQNLSLPEGSVYQPTGQRRPLIVFPK